MVKQFAYRIRELREQQHLLQRQVAALLDIDTPLLSKIERGERVAKKEMVIKLSVVLKGNKDELLTLWLADQLHNVIEGEALGDEALKKVSGNIKKINKKSYKH